MNNVNFKNDQNQKILSEGRVQEFCKPAHYPISELIFEIASSLGSSPCEVTARLGLRNKRRSAKRLNRWIAEATGHLGFLSEFGQVTGFSQNLNQAIESTRELRLLERKANMWREAEQLADRFEPSIFVVPVATCPKTIFIEAITEGRFRLVSWESYAEEGDIEARIRAGLVCEQHFRENDGECWNWGPIKEYCFAEAWNRHSLIGTDGSVTKVVEEPCEMPQASLELKGSGRLEEPGVLRRLVVLALLIH